MVSKPVGLLLLAVGFWGGIATAVAFSNGQLGAWLLAVVIIGFGAGLLITWRAPRSAVAPRNQGETVAPAAGMGEQRMRDLSLLAAGLAHELGQPLSAARVSLEGLHYLRQLGRHPEPTQVERTLTRVGLNLLTMTQTIDHLQGLVKADLVPCQQVDLVHLIEGLLRERDAWLRYHDARIAWDPPPLPVPALVDPAGLRLVLTNLLRNAVEAVSHLGEECRWVHMTVGPGARITITDLGPGIPPDQLERIFDLFHSSKSGGLRGIGLSLALVSAQRMGAELTVTSQAGQGTTFTVVLAEPGPVSAATTGVAHGY